MTVNRTVSIFKLFGLKDGAGAACARRAVATWHCGWVQRRLGWPALQRASTCASSARPTTRA
jgi:hypothetical protein